MATELFDRLNEPDQNHKQFVTLAGTQGDKRFDEICFNLPSGYELKAFTNAESALIISILNHHNERVAFYLSDESVDWHIEQVSNDKPLRQVTIWRARFGEDNLKTRDLAEAIFCKVLLESFNVVITDSEHNRECRHMLEGFLQASITSNDHRAAPGNTGSKAVEWIDSESSLCTPIGWLWGEREVHPGRFALIVER